MRKTIARYFQADILADSIREDLGVDTMTPEQIRGDRNDQVRGYADVLNEAVRRGERALAHEKRRGVYACARRVVVSNSSSLDQRLLIAAVVITVVLVVVALWRPTSSPFATARRVPPPKPIQWPATAAPSEPTLWPLPTAAPTQPPPTALLRQREGAASDHGR